MPVPLENVTILTVYFSGTGHDIEDTGKANKNNERPLGSFLYQNTKETDTQLKQGFSGTGLTNGVRGSIFGTGLECPSNRFIKLQNSKKGVGSLY